MLSYKSILILVIIFSLITLLTYAEQTRFYLNETNSFTVQPGTFKVLGLSANLSNEESVNHTFDGFITVGSSTDFDIRYISSNESGYLLRLRFDASSGADTDRIQKIQCNSDIVNSTICSNGCTNMELSNYNRFSILLNFSSSSARIFMNGTSQGTASFCSGVNEIGSINFSGVASGTYQVEQTTVTANNKPPQFISNLPNITWPEDTSTDFNISGNFSDSNNDTLTYSYTNVENITLSVNNATGIVNLTPNPDFFGIRYVVFYANDGSNVTASNNVTLNVTNVNDAPTITTVTLSNSDFENRTNGSLTAAWIFSDPDNEVMSRNETLWYANGVENESLRNLTAIGSGNTTKGQNWSFSIRVFDGTVFSEWNYSGNITIQNSLQYFNPALGVEHIERNSLFTYDINYTDIDGDIVTFSDNSSLFNITNEGIINFTPATTGNITVNITISEDSDISDILTIEVKDTVAPVITAISTSSSGTTTVIVTLSATTDETAECRFATSNISFSDMAQISTTNSTSHSNSQSFTSDASGTYYVRCNDTSGNLMAFSNSTSYNADIQEPSSDSEIPTISSSSGSGNTGWQCRYDWKCTKWSECINGKKTRDCEVVKVEPFYSETKCAYMGRIDTEEECEMPRKEEQKAIEKPEEENLIEEKVDKQGLPAITGRAILSDLIGNPKLRHGLIILSVVIVVLSMLFYYGHFKKPPENLSEEEKIRLNKMLEEEP